jgi:SOS-response transcriptional repressor LexA
MHKTQELILDLVRNGGWSRKTLREVGAEIGCPSAQQVKHHLEQLVGRGLVSFDRATKSARVSRPVFSPAGLVPVPIVGAANCGPATIFANENIEGYLRVSPRLLKKTSRVFAIRAQGISMNRAQVDGETIEDGDYLIIDADYRDPKNGDIVLSVIDDAANIKKFLWDDETGQIVLVSESTKDIPPIYIHEDDSFMVNGRVIQVIKKPRQSAGMQAGPQPAKRLPAAGRRTPARRRLR